MLRFRSPLILAAVLLIGASALSWAAQEPSAKQAGSSTRPAEPAEIQEVQEVTAVEASHPLTFADLIGRMHPALVHFPIGWMVLLLLVEIIATVTGREDWSKAGFLLLMGLVASMVPAVVTGFLRASALGNDSETLELIATHRNLNIAAGLTGLLALGLRYFWRNDLGASKRRAYLVLLVCGTLLMLLAGHYGGKMVFGKEYLPF